MTRAYGMCGFFVGAYNDSIIIFALRFLKLIIGEVGEWLKPHVC